MVDILPLLVLGGTFDPVHLGHLRMARFVMDRLGSSELLFVPALNPHGKKAESAARRLEMLELALKCEKGMAVSTVELQRGGNGPSYTVDTLRELKVAYPKRRLCFVLGADQAARLSEWKEPDELVKLADLVVVPRPGAAVPTDLVGRYNLTVLDGFAAEVSATAIRSGQSLLTPRRVIEYMVDNDLYFLRRLHSLYRERRYAHARSVAQVAYEIAGANGLEPTKAYLAGLYHDAAKKLAPDECRRLMADFPDKLQNCPDFALHQFAGAALAAREFGIADREILASIAFHTTGRPAMSPYEKIIYAADKIEPRRGFDSAELIRAMKQNYDRGFLKVLRANREYLYEHGAGEGTELTLATYDYYLKQGA